MSAQCAVKGLIEVNRMSHMKVEARLAVRREVVNTHLLTFSSLNHLTSATKGYRPSSLRYL
jgi:hypothetical protein